MLSNILLAAQEAVAEEAPQQGGGMSMIVMMILILVIMWFFMIRPQTKRQKEIRNFQNSITEGTEIVTGGGVYGRVKRIDTVRNTVEVEVARGVVITVDRGYIFKDMASTTMK